MIDNIPGSAGASPAVFGAPAKDICAREVAGSRHTYPKVSREAHDTAGEAPALPKPFSRPSRRVVATPLCRRKGALHPSYAYYDDRAPYLQALTS